jgi:hypothetical protein
LAAAALRRFICSDTRFTTNSTTKNTTAPSPASNHIRTSIMRKAPAYVEDARGRSRRQSETVKLHSHAKAEPRTGIGQCFARGSTLVTCVTADRNGAQRFNSPSKGGNAPRVNIPSGASPVVCAACAQANQPHTVTLGSRCELTHLQLSASLALQISPSSSCRVRAPGRPLLEGPLRVGSGYQRPARRRTFGLLSPLDQLSLGFRRSRVFAARFFAAADGLPSLS